MADANKTHKEFLSIIKNYKINAIAPAGFIDPEQLLSLRKIKNLHFNFPDRCYTTNSFLHAHNDDVRFECLKDTLFDDSTPIIWALRGGYGAAKLIPMLMEIKKPDKEKFFIGYSDLTALHIFISQNWGWKTIHGDILFALNKENHSPENFIKLAKIITGRTTKAKINNLKAMNDAAIAAKTISGKITGGNLTIVQTSIGTDWQIQTKDKILFLEDISLHPHMIDRALLQLKQAKLLDNVKAIIFGEFIEEKAEKSNLVKRTLTEFAQSVQIPCFTSNRFGHFANNDPLVYNTPSVVSKDSTNGYSLVMDLLAQ